VDWSGTIASTRSVQISAKNVQRRDDDSVVCHEEGLEDQGGKQMMLGEALPVVLRGVRRQELLGQPNASRAAACEDLVFGCSGFCSVRGHECPRASIEH
jgi:hypothetical protein